MKYAYIYLNFKSITKIYIFYTRICHTDERGTYNMSSYFYEIKKKSTIEKYIITKDKIK